MKEKKKSWKLKYLKKKNKNKIILMQIIKFKNTF